MELRTLDAFLNELSPRVRPLIAQTIENEFYYEVLDFFRRRAKTSLEVYDIGYHLRRPPEVLDMALRSLVGSGFLRCRDIFDLTFYSLTDDPELLQALEFYWDWRESWQAFLDQLKLNLHYTTDRLFVTRPPKQHPGAPLASSSGDNRIWKTDPTGDEGSSSNRWDEE